MDGFLGNYTYWWLSAGIVLSIAVAVSVIPRGRPREILVRILILLPFSVTVCWAAVAMAQPLYLHNFAAVGKYLFWLLLALLATAPVVIALLLPKSKIRAALINGFLWIAGAVSLLLGIIGALLPVMPTVPFILLTAACWGRASPGFHRWLRQNRLFGTMITGWEISGAIPRRAKYLAWMAMSVSTLSLLLKFSERWYVGAGTGLVCLCIGLWMATRPDA